MLEESSPAVPAKDDAPSWFARKPVGIRLLIVLGGAAAIIALLVGMASCQAAAEDREAEERAAERAAAIAAMAPREVVYEVTGDGTYFSMTASTPTGTVQQNPDLPLQTTDGGNFGFNAPPGEPLYISAQIENGSSITCRIKVDGVIISENTSTGTYSIASCDGVVPQN
jgi:hypothetical protein